MPGIADNVYIVGAVALVLAQAALIGGLVVHAARRRKAEKEARGSRAEVPDRDDRIRGLGGRLLSAQEAERSRIARQLHDDVSQQLGLLAFDLQSLSAACVDDHADIRGIAQAALARTQSLLKGVHDLSHDLHPAKLHLLGMVGAIASLQREFTESGMPVTFSHDSVPLMVPPDLALCVYRTVQEAIQNARKHSASHYVSVHLGYDEEELILTIADDGIGFDVNAVAGKGLGLAIMKERIEMLGGTLNIRSKAGRGTRLEVSVPCSAAQVIEGRPTSDTGKVA